MYNILQISNELGIGGTERVLCSICRHMNYGLFRHFVAGFFRGGERCAEICRYSKTFILAGSLNKLKDCIVNNGIDVVIMHRAGKAEKHWSNILRICKENNVKVILEFNVFGLVDVSDEDKFIDWHLHVSKTSYYNFQKRAARLNYNGVATHRVIYNPVEIKNFRKLRLNKDDAADVRKGLGLSDEDFVLLRVGRPDVRKWSDIFLSVVPDVIKRIPQAKFIFLSAPASRERYFRKQWYSNNINVLPAMTEDEEIAKYYSIADLYVHSSRRGESFGLTIAEAFSFGLPVVVDSTPWRDNAQIELVDHMENGIVVNDYLSFENAVEYLYKHQGIRAEMGKKGFEKALDYYEAEKVIGSLSKLILTTLFSKEACVISDSVQLDQYTIYPDMSEIGNYVDYEYKKRLETVWSSQVAKQDSMLDRAKWFLSDTMDILKYKLDHLIRT